MEKDPVRLVVKNTFLQLDSTPSKIRTGRRCSDTTNDASGLFADVHEFLQGVPPGVFHPPSQLLPGRQLSSPDEVYEPEPFSPMLISVPGAKSTASRRGSEDDKLNKPPLAGVALGRPGAGSDTQAAQFAPSRSNLGVRRRADSFESFERADRRADSFESDDAYVDDHVAPMAPNRALRRWGNPDEEYYGGASKPSMGRENGEDDRYTPQFASKCSNHSSRRNGDDDGLLYDYAYPSAMPPAVPTTMPFGITHGLPGMDQAYMPMVATMPPNEMFLPVPGPWGFPAPMHGAWSSGYHPAPSCPPSAAPPVKQQTAIPKRPTGGKGSAKAAKDSGDSQWRELQPEEFTTVMLRNLPGTYTRNSLQCLLDHKGFQGVYNFIYMPMNFRSKASFGYAFVNFVTNATAKTAHEVFQDFKDWDVPSDKVCDVSWSNMHQGLEAHLDRYRNSPVMHESTADAYKPALFSPSGERATFPAPTKKLRMPRIRRPSAGEQGEGDGAADD